MASLDHFGRVRFSSLQWCLLLADTGIFRHFFALLGSGQESDAAGQPSLVRGLVRQSRDRRRSGIEKSSRPRWCQRGMMSSYPVVEVPVRGQPAEETDRQVAVTIALAGACVPPPNRCSVKDVPRNSHVRLPRLPARRRELHFSSSLRGGEIYSRHINAAPANASCQ